MNTRNSPLFLLCWLAALSVTVRLHPQSGVGRGGLGGIEPGPRFADDNCHNRSSKFLNPARMPVDPKQPEATLLFFAGETQCISLTNYYPLNVDASARPREKLWSPGALGLVDAACPFQLMGAEGFYLLRLTPTQRPGTPPTPSYCIEGPEYRTQSVLLMALSGETTVVTYRTELVTSQTYWSLAPELRAQLGAIAEKPKLIRIPGGEFFMGCDANSRRCAPDEAPGHLVKLDHEFQLMEAEVSLGDYLDRQLRGSSALPVLRPLKLKLEGFPLWLPLSYPATMVSWEQASWHCRQAGGRLPTEAERERAAGQNLTATSDGLPPVRNDRELVVRKLDELRRLRSAGLYGGPDSHGLLPVRSQLPGLRGLYDMTGNVSQWVEDWFDPKYYSERRHDNPEGAYLGKQKLVRGLGAGEVAGFELQDSAHFLSRSDEVWRRFTRDGKPAPDIGFRCAFDWTVGN